MARPLYLFICLLFVASAYSSNPTTDGPTSKATTDGPTSTVTTDTPTSKVTTGPTSKVTTDGPTSKVTTDTPTSKVTTGPTSKVTTDGPTSKVTTDGPTSKASAKPTTPGGSAKPSTPGGSAKPTTPGGSAKPSTPGGSAKPSTPGASANPGSTSETTKPIITNPPKPTETEKPAPGCASSPCGGGSICQDRAEQTYECLCPTGDSYDEKLKDCLRAKTFPGDLTYEGDYTDAMANPNSADFKRVADDIVKKLDTEYRKNSTYKYLNSVVTKLSKPPTKAGGIIASVDIMFQQDSPVTSKNVEDGASAAGTLEVKSLCSSNPCDVTTTKCADTNGGFSCTCNEGYLQSSLSDRVCVACPNGQKVDAESKTCVKCGFGKSGFNCKDQWQLILTIVGSVLGGLLLVCIILLPVVAMNSKKKVKKAKASSSYDNPKSKPAPVKTPQVSNGLAAPRPTPNKATPAGGLGGFGVNGVPRIPRATTYDSWDRDTNLEMVPSNSRQNLLPSARNTRRFDDDDDISPYSQTRKPQNNPYAVTRPQTNPYASNQGNTNPYYRH